MTTMDSDSESQDSDDGRRFRFEATRKDVGAGVAHSRNRRSPLPAFDLERRSRSRDRSVRDRKDHDRSRNAHDKKSPTHNESSRRISKDRDTNGRHDKESRSSKCRDDKDLRTSVNHKDPKDSKDSGPKSGKTSDKDSKNSRVRPVDARDLIRGKESKDSKDRDRDKRRSQERSHERNHDDKSSEKHGSRGRDRYKHHSRDRSRDRSVHTAKTKSSRDQPIKHEPTQKLSKKEDKAKTLKEELNSPSIILDQIGSDSESDLGALDSDVGPVLALDDPDCKDLNLSDFEIVSDTEEDSSGESASQSPARGPIIKGEILPPHYYKPRIRQRVSRQQYERIMKHQAVRNRRLSQLHKVIPSSGDERLPGSRDSNPPAVSDSLLGPAPSEITSTPTAIEDRACCAREQGIRPDDKDIINKRSGEEPCTVDINMDQSSGSGTSGKSQDSKEANRGSAYGPALPPVPTQSSSSSQCNSDVPSANLAKTDFLVTTDKDNWSKSSSEVDHPTASSDDKPERVYGPVLLVRSDTDRCHTVTSEEPRIIGPSLPDHLQKHSAESEDEKESIFGPALPPHLMPQSFIGPTLPQTVKCNDSVEHSVSTLDNEDTFGPLPLDHPAAKDCRVQQELEERAKLLKNKIKTEDDVDETKREEWMMELPPAQAVNLGLGPRKFRARPGPDMSDRSSWTDTPADKIRKREEQRKASHEKSEPCLPPPQQQQPGTSEKSTSKKHQDSLLELHQKKLRKKKKKEEKEAKETGKPIRRPFDRDIDLQANRLDDANKKAIFMKARLLDDRFSRGKL
ncbi:uncharacterized protein LOC105702161 [Orussus abietinus]|uniref:uncharacterized protein LOC105702161 n=1 Tax=Orussus abietinus TaxID=222816 RepID=UPI0006255177|nr:uncharacterized protein LOC105702161 [Orussus abietinus]XP_012284936.1 uncharacterized protein LOC105702161 [Orussus abietinus]XP_012284937.1 uncharacterized protein LOC105702161 [Orussus abietinus]